jgi:dTDP-4-dehydrorhamnose reductase
MRIAVTGATGRLGSAVLDAVTVGSDAGIAWGRGDFDLDDPASLVPSLDRDRPDVVVHCAAWTDVDGCAREPALAERRNGTATGALAEACAQRAIGLVVVSTNEVFDGRRTDGIAYLPSDPTTPSNAYGRSKLHGELAAGEAYARAGTAPLWIVRTAWLFGGPGRDFPAKIVDAARTAREAGAPLRLVADEIGTPTLARDLAAGIADLIREPATSGIHQVVNDGVTSRAGWARRVLLDVGIDVATEDVPMSTWTRPSAPPAWGVMAPTPLPTIGRLRAWEAALDEELARRGTPVTAR